MEVTHYTAYMTIYKSWIILSNWQAEKLLLCQNLYNKNIFFSRKNHRDYVNALNRSWLKLECSIMTNMYRAYISVSTLMPWSTTWPVTEPLDPEPVALPSTETIRTTQVQDWNRNRTELEQFPVFPVQDHEISVLCDSGVLLDSIYWTFSICK